MYSQSDEIEERVKKVADYIIKTGASTRKAAEYFSSHDFKISNVTVSNYMTKRLPKIDGCRYALVKKVIDKNTPKSVESLEVRNRIYDTLNLLFQGYTIPQIVVKMNETSAEKNRVTFDIIYDDLIRRLKMIENDLDVIRDVQDRLYKNKIGTLNNQENNGPNMDALNQPRIRGKFASKSDLKENGKGRSK